MNTTRALPIALFATLVAHLAAPAVAKPEERPGEAVRLTTWNVENLFDAADDPEREDRVVTPAALDQKLANLARVLRDIGGETPPEIVAVQEVETEGLLRRLGRRVHGERPFATRHARGKDARGLGVGVLTTWRVLEHEAIDDGEPASRPILRVRMVPPPGRRSSPLSTSWSSTGSPCGRPGARSRSKTSGAGGGRRG
jgi:hypothetical protein